MEADSGHYLTSIDRACNIVDAMPKIIPPNELPLQEYHALPSVSSSRISTIARFGVSEYVDQFILKTKARASTRSTTVGTCIHDAALLGHTRFTIKRGGKNSKDACCELIRSLGGVPNPSAKMDELKGHAEFLELDLLSKGGFILDEKDAGIVDRDVEAINRVFDNLRGPHSLIEHTIIWTDPETGLEARTRPDVIIRDGDGPVLIHDIKSCYDVTDGGIRRAISEYCYDIQSVFEVAGVVSWMLGRDVGFREALGYLADRAAHRLIFVSTDPMASRDFTVRMAAIGTEVLDLAAMDIQKYMAMAKAAHEAKEPALLEDDRTANVCVIDRLYRDRWGTV